MHPKTVLKSHTVWIFQRAHTVRRWMGLDAGERFDVHEGSVVKVELADKLRALSTRSKPQHSVAGSL